MNVLSLRPASRYMLSIIYHEQDITDQAGRYWTHAAIYAGYGYVGSYIHPYNTSAGAVVYNTTVNKVYMHARDRGNAPWNIGFRARYQAATSSQASVLKGRVDATTMQF